MGGRYLVTGVQLGALKGLVRGGSTSSLIEATYLLDEIIDYQFIGESEDDIEDDIGRYCRYGSDVII